MYKVIILPLAKEDIKEAAQWYNDKQKGLGKRFIGQVKQRVSSIQKNPFAIAVRYDDVRTAVLKDFPFMVHYRINDSKKLVIVIAVFNTSRDPERWKDR